MSQYALLMTLMISIDRGREKCQKSLTETEIEPICLEFTSQDLVLLLALRYWLVLIFINCVTSHNLTYLGFKKTEYYGVQDRKLISVKK